LPVRAIVTDVWGPSRGLTTPGFCATMSNLQKFVSRPSAGHLVHLRSDQVVSVAGVVLLADPDCFAAGALVDVIDQPADSREGFTGLGEIHDEHGLQRICR